MINLLIKKKSCIHGIGIFATQNIEKDTIFYKIPTDVILNKPNHKWAYIGEGKWLSDEKVLNYVNHSCSPNSSLDISDQPKLIAKKKIKVGEEITVDYNKTEKNGLRTLCNCKSIKCKKYFN